jgi:hypothetical protein
MYVIEADQRSMWGRIIAGLAVPEPELVTVQIPSRARPGEADEEFREYAEKATIETLLRRAQESERTVVAFGPLRHEWATPDSGSEREVPFMAQLMVWKRQALVVPLVQGWNGEWY